MECGYPAPINHGTYNLLNGTKSFLSMVAYECEEGYRLIGQNQLVCDVDARWNGPPPRCEGGTSLIVNLIFFVTVSWMDGWTDEWLVSAVECPPPPVITNGDFLLSSRTPVYGTSAEYFCLSDRFTLQGSKKIVCQTTGRYDREPPVCIG